MTSLCSMKPATNAIHLMASMRKDCHLVDGMQRVSNQSMDTLPVVPVAQHDGK